MFKKYVSKPIIRMAHQLTALDEVTATGKESTSYFGKGEQLVEFKHYEPVKVGDFVVYLNDDDIYHCSKEVFEERNVV